MPRRMSVVPVASQTRTFDGGTMIRAAPNDDTTQGRQADVVANSDAAAIGQGDLDRLRCGVGWR